jgi:outer membrane receptor protein involved in Fe transport
MLNNKLAKAVRLAIAFGGASSAVFAANVNAAEEQAIEEVERIEVTGSRIKRADMEGANPVQVLSREDLVASGITNIGDILQEIPSVAGAGTNTAVNNGGSGAVRVSLRGLGSERTLVLLNGRRVVSSGLGANASVDLSTIPTAIIKRVEVLKDGASAIYGSDAIGGVVNVITRDDFEGFEANASYDASTHGGDGETKSYDFTIGFSGDKGNVVVNAYYVEQGPQWSGDRDWSQYEYGLDPDTLEFTKGGSSAPPWGRYNGIDGEIGGEACGSFTHGAGSGPGQSDPSDFSNSTGYDCWDWDKDTYNYAPANYHLTPQERYGLFAQGGYEFTDSFRFFSELSFSRRTSDTKLAPLPLAPLAFFGVTNATYSKDNYYNQMFGPKDKNGNTVDITDWRRRMVETGGRDSSFRVETLRSVIGFEGEFGDSWGYEVSYIFGRNDSATAGAGGVNFEKVSDAVGPSFLDAEGNIVCGTADAPIAGCVSLNTFGIPGTETGVTQEMLDYITFEAHDFGYNEQQIISASVFGEAFDLPAGAVGVAFGLEHREEKGGDYPDALIALGITSGSSRTSTEGSYSVNEAFVEANLPILDGAFLAEVLEVDLAVRYSDYDTFGDTTNHKIGVRWAPMDGLMLRGTSSTAFRAPSTSDLFAGNSDNSPLVSDPCQTNPTASCIADGVPAAGFEPIGDQLSSTLGGNPDLTPEEADIFTLGLVYSPNFVDGLSFTLDYWDITLTNAITTIGEQLILDKCASSGLYCDLITRYADGILEGNSSDIDNRNTNVGGIDSSGLDFNVNYAADTSFGALTLNLDTTRYDTYDITQADGSVVENAGWFRRNSGDGNFPEWKSNFNARLTQGDWAAGYSMRYIGDVKEPWSDSDAGERTIDSQMIHDVTFSYFFDNYTTTIGVNNLLDEDPPYAVTGFNDNTDPRTYNTTGRHIFLTLSASF